MDCMKRYQVILKFAQYISGKIEEKGILYVSRNALYEIMGLLIIILLYPFVRLMNVKFLGLYIHAVGHLCTEPDLYIKEGILGLRPEYNTVIVASKRKVANAHILNYWKQYIKVISSPLLCFFLEPLTRNRFTNYPLFHLAFSENASYYPEIQKRYFGQPALLNLSESDFERGWTCLRDIGVPEGAWFICVHSREDGYLGPMGYTCHNADINNYYLAMEAIVGRGGWVIRMGDQTMKPLQKADQIVDYALLDIKSDWMDVFLCASCRFFLGSASGLCQLPTVFGVSDAIANLAPHLSGVLQTGPEDIGIPKLLWSDKEERYLSFKEILGSPISKYWFDSMFYEAGLRPVENTSEEIRDLVLEMLDRKEGRLSYTIEDELRQKRFKSLMNPTHFSYGAMSRVGSDFLRKYEHLLS